MIGNLILYAFYFTSPRDDEIQPKIKFKKHVSLRRM